MCAVTFCRRFWRFGPFNSCQCLVEGFPNSLFLARGFFCGFGWVQGLQVTAFPIQTLCISVLMLTPPCGTFKSIQDPRSCWTHWRPAPSSPLGPGSVQGAALLPTGVVLLSTGAVLLSTRVILLPPGAVLLPTGAVLLPATQGRRCAQSSEFTP